MNQIVYRGFNLFSFCSFYVHITFDNQVALKLEY